MPKTLYGHTGTQLSNNDLLLCGGSTNRVESNEYLFYKNGSKKWTKAGTMKRARNSHSSALIEDYLFTPGGWDWESGKTSYHEEFSIHGGVKEREKMPIGLRGHTATPFGNNKMMICGGRDENWVSKTFSKLLKYAEKFFNLVLYKMI